MLINFLQEFAKSKSPGVSSLIYLFLKETEQMFMMDTIKSELGIAKKNVEDALLFLTNEGFVKLEENCYFVQKAMISDIDQNVEYPVEIVELASDSLVCEDVEIIEANNKKPGTKDYYYLAVKILEDLNFKSGKSFSMSDFYLKKIEKHLKNGATERDFFLVNGYFSSEWNTLEMSKHIAPITLYNGKFQARVDEANNYLASLNKNSRSSVLVWQYMNSLYHQYGMVANEFMNKKDMEQISFWCEKYPVDKINEVVNNLFLEWGGNPKFSKHLTIGVIFSEKFPERFDRYVKISQNMVRANNDTVVLEVYEEALKIQRMWIKNDLSAEENLNSLDADVLQFFEWVGGFDKFMALDKESLKQKCSEFIGV